MLVGHEAGEGQGVDVVAADHRAEGKGGLVFQAAGRMLILRPVDDGEVGFVDMGDAAAGDGAAETRLVGNQVGVAVGVGPLHGRRVDVADALELDFLEIAGRQTAPLLHHVDHGAGAVFGEFRGALAGSEGRMGLLDRGHEGLGVVHGNALGAMNRDGLEVFRAHDGADAGASGGAVQVIDYAGELDAVLAGQADRGDFHERVLVLRLERRLGLPHGLAPKIAGRDDFHVVVLDAQVAGLGRLAVNDDHIVAGELKLGAELAARIGAGDGVGQRALGDNRIAPAGRGHGAGQRPGGEDQDILRRHGVGLGVHVLHEVFRRQATLTEIRVGPFHVERFGFGRTLGEVDPKNLFLPSHDGNSCP